MRRPGVMDRIRNYVIKQKMAALVGDYVHRNIGREGGSLG